MKVIIVAGGKGTRIASVNKEVPKPMIPIAGKPVVEYQVELAKSYGFTDILFILGHLGNQIQDYFGDGEKWGVNIEYYQELIPLGTSGALPLIVDKLTDKFWVFYGDTIMDFDMNRMLNFHNKYDAIATLFLHPNDHPQDSDLVDVAADGLVRSFYPKPHQEGVDYHNQVNAALYILDKTVVDFIPHDVKSDFGKDIFPKIINSTEKIAGYISPEYIKDMGTPDRWESVGHDIISGKVARLNIRNQRPAIFLDRDGVVNIDVDLLNKSEQMELIEGAAEAIRMINKAGFLAVLVTNQPVIARNLCSLDELDDIHKRLEMLLGEKGAYLDAIYFCPHHPHSGYPEERREYKIECNCRKPKPGMLLQSALKLNIDMAESYMIGDREWDIMAGGAAGVKESFLIKQNTRNQLLDIIDEIITKK